MDHPRRPDGTTSPDGTASPDGTTSPDGAASPGHDTRVAGRPKPPSEPQRPAAPAQQAAPARPAAAPRHGTSPQQDTSPQQGMSRQHDRSPQQDTAPVQAAGRPGHPGQGRAAEPAALRGLPERLLDPSDAERFRRRWREVQSGFVDDPGDAVRRADELAAEVTDAFGRALAAHRRALAEPPAQGRDDRPDTERLRLALRGYRDLLDRVFDA